MSFPTKEERAQCWGARDKYWECLDEQKGEVNVCKEFRKLYENSCTAQWVKHFDRKRNYLQFKEKIEKDGYEPLSEERFSKKSNHKLRLSLLCLNQEEFTTKL